MGAGKSEASKFLSSLYNSFDLDNIIEEVTGIKIHNIFKQKGESYFRFIEKFIFNRLIYFDDIIISLGGGTLHNVLSYCSNQEDKANDSEYLQRYKINDSFQSDKIFFQINQNCKILFLYCDLKILFERVKKSERPKVNTFDEFEKLYFERLPIYLKYSDFLVDTNSENWGKKILLYAKKIGISTIKDPVLYKKIIESIKKDYYSGIEYWS